MSLLISSVCPTILIAVDPLATLRKSITVFAPASSANLGSGFDVFGLALQGPGDQVRLERNTSGVIRIASIKGDGRRLSRVTSENTAGVALMAFREAIGDTSGFDIHLTKQMPLGSGMGSSAASAVAAVFAANVLLGHPMNKQELVRWAAEGERVASGSVHADNIAPSMIGGITLVRSLQADDILSLPVPAKLRIVLVHPHVEVKTSDARKVLPRQIELGTAIKQWSNTASFVAGCYQNDLALVGRSMEDFVAEPARKSLIPLYAAAKSLSLELGACGVSISGAGPSILVLTDSAMRASRISVSLQQLFRKNRIGCDVWCTRVDRKGARILSNR